MGNKKPWSISTTVRNPERLRDFLRVLKRIEGENFTTENQVKYQVLLIQEKLYKPIYIPSKYQKYYEEPDSLMPYEVAQEIFECQNYKDPPMRGRQSVNPLNKLGFAIARKGYGPIRITELGNLFLRGDYDIGFTFFKSLLKLQFPNPWSKDFSSDNGFNIIPFIATLKLIRKINEYSEEKGLSKDEFCIFVPTLIDARDIDHQIERILTYRKLKKQNSEQEFVIKFVQDFFGTTKKIEKHINNLFDYGDNAIRYFRLTRYFSIKADPLGYHWRVDLEPSRILEIDQLLEQYNGEAFVFNTIQEYLDYISDIKQPTLPWEKLDSLRKIAINLQDMIKSLLLQKTIQLSKEELDALKIDINTLSKNALEQQILKLRELNRKIRLLDKKKQLLGNVEKINKIISILENNKLLRKIQPEKFEQLLTEALKILNDELLIQPNYPMDDEGEPLTHAPGNKPDIECYYKRFKATCEVTLNTSRLQWVQEGQPVMRHLRDFEKRYDFDDNIYCIFVAPKIHKDTYSQFWISVKYEYDGRPQKIIPLSTKQFALLLKKLLRYLKIGQKFTHYELYRLYKRLIEETKNCNSFSEWSEKIDKVLLLWMEEKV